MIINRAIIGNNGNLLKDNQIVPYGDYFAIQQEETEDIVEYELISVINHCGENLEGHSTALCKKNLKWFCIDNDNVWEIHDHLSPDGYVLIYKIIKLN